MPTNRFLVIPYRTKEAKASESQSQSVQMDDTEDDALERGDVKVGSVDALWGDPVGDAHPT